MPLYPLTDSDLKNFQDILSGNANPSIGFLNDLKALYARFLVNEQELISAEYLQVLNRVEQEYLEKKKDCQTRLTSLKTLYKQIDNRIISVEQKLSHGIPEDLLLMDKLIAEQEAIVEEQEKLNAAEVDLVAYVSDIDVQHGQTLSNLAQQKSNRQAPLQSKFENDIQLLVEAEKKIKLKTDLFALIPFLLIPLILDFIGSKLGIATIGAKAATHGILSHYLFFITLILTYLFLVEPIKTKIFNFFASSLIKQTTTKLANLLAENLKSTAAIQTQQKG